MHITNSTQLNNLFELCKITFPMQRVCIPQYDVISLSTSSISEMRVTYIPRRRLRQALLRSSAQLSGTKQDRIMTIAISFHRSRHSVPPLQLQSCCNPAAGRQATLLEDIGFCARPLASPFQFFFFVVCVRIF